MSGESSNRKRGLELSRTAHSRLAGAALRQQPDARLVKLARSGYSQAFDEIARRYRASLTSFAGSIVPANRAEDVVQDALVKAYRSLPRSDGELNLRPWLYTIVRNTALNNLRDERPHERLDESWDGVPQPPEVAARRAELATLVRGIQNLPAPQRQALVRRELEGRSHEEIASTLGTTPGAVRALIFRARTALRDGAGMLIPLPALRALLDAGPTQVETAGAGIGGATAALTSGGGGAAALKAGAGLAALVLAVGSGVAIHDRGGSGGDGAARPLADARHGGSGGAHGASQLGRVSRSDESPNAGPGSDSRGERGPGSDSGRGSSGPSGDSGSARPEDGGSGSSGSADSGDGEGRDGGGGGDRGEGGSGSSLTVSDSDGSGDAGGGGSRDGTSGSGSASLSSGTSGSGSGTSGSDDGSSTDSTLTDSISGSSGSGSSGDGSTIELSSSD